MPKNIDLKKILEKASVKRKTLLLADHLAQEGLEGKGFLTEDEFNAILQSIKTPRAKKIYDRLRKAAQKVGDYLQYLNALFMEYQKDAYTLLYLVALWNTLMITEESYNSILFHTRSRKAKKEILKTIKKHSPYIWGSIEAYVIEDPNCEGYVLMDLDDDSAFLTFLNHTKSRTQWTQRQLKAAINLIYDYMKETGAKIKVYEKKIKSYESWARTFNIPIPLHSHCKRGLIHLPRELEEKYKVLTPWDRAAIDHVFIDHLKRILL